MATSCPRFEYAIDRTVGLAYARFRGVLTGDDMLHAVAAVHGDSLWEPHFDAIWDCSRVTSHAVAPHELSPLLDEAVEVSEAEGAGGRDVLVESPALGEDLFATLLVFALRARGEQAHTCRTVADALAWLGLHALPERLRPVAEARR